MGVQLVQFHGPLPDDGGHEDVVVSETRTDSGGIDLGLPQEGNAEQDEMQTVPDRVLSAPHVDTKQLDLTDDVASDTHSSKGSQTQLTFKICGITTAGFS